MRRERIGGHRRPAFAIERSEEDVVATDTGPGNGERPAEDVQQAVNRLRTELTRLSGEIERTATAQFEQRKPELRSSMDDLEAAIDALATKAKGFLGDLKTRLDDAGTEAAERGEEHRASGGDRR